MAHDHRRNAAYSGTWPAADANVDESTDYIASRVRSREEKDAAAREAQRRAAANRDEVLRETTRMTQKHSRNVSDKESRQRGHDGIDATHRGIDVHGAHESGRNAVRFSSPPGRLDDLRGRTTERTKFDSSGNRPHDRRSPRSQSPHATTTCWTSRLKAFTSSSHGDRPARTETSTTISQDHNYHCHRRRRSKERVRPQDIPSTSQPRYASQSRHARPQLQTSPPPPPQHPFPTMPPPQPTPQYPHITQFSSGNRIDVYLGAGPSGWHIRDNNTSTSSNPPQPPFPPPLPAAHQQTPAFATQPASPPPPHVRHPDLFGQITMHGLHNMQPAVQHQHQHLQNPVPQQSQPQRNQNPPPMPPKVPHESSGASTNTSARNAQAPAQQQQQQQQQQQTPLPLQQQQGYPVPKNRMPVWDDQAQSVRWEWR